jgi:hypothetical protein
VDILLLLHNLSLLLQDLVHAKFQVHLPQLKKHLLLQHHLVIHQELVILIVKTVMLDLDLMVPVLVT